MFRGLGLTAALACIVAASAGCGGSDSSPASSLSAAEWRTEANAVCRRVGREIRAVRPARKETEVTAFVAAVAPLWKRELDSTRALAAPTEIVVHVGQYVGALDFLNRNLVTMFTAAVRQDSSRLYDAALSIEHAGADAKRAARALRLPACAAQRIP